MPSLEAGNQRKPEKQTPSPNASPALVTCYLGLGSNLGDRLSNLAKALHSLAKRVKVERVSSVYETEPVGYLEQPVFLNAVCRISTDLSPFDLLSLVKETEVELGRVPSFPNAPRLIDVDILFYDDQVIETPPLTIPHSRMVERAFVLIPLAEVAPDLIHPLQQKTASELAAKVSGKRGVRKLTCQLPSDYG